MLEAGPLDAPVPWCGEWRAGRSRRAPRLRCTAGRRLHADRPPGVAGTRSGAGGRGGDGRLVARRRRAALLDALRAIDLDGADVAPVHRGARSARCGRGARRRRRRCTAGTPSGRSGWTPTIDAALAADGIDEYFVLALPRLIKREGVAAPERSMLVRTTDTGD